MIQRVANRLMLLAWPAALIVAGFLAADTIVTIKRVGLVGARPPLSAAQTALRIAIIMIALALVYVFHNVLERITLLIAAAAAGSSALYGFGVRSAGLSAFRLLSHLAAYGLIMFVAGRMTAVTLRRLKTGHTMTGREA